jgi:hypothetical protein
MKIQKVALRSDIQVRGDTRARTHTHPSLALLGEHEVK